jgi:hypothetical protein
MAVDVEYLNMFPVIYPLNLSFIYLPISFPVFFLEMCLDSLYMKFKYSYS